MKHIGLILLCWSSVSLGGQYSGQRVQPDFRMSASIEALQIDQEEFRRARVRVSIYGQAYVRSLDATVVKTERHDALAIIERQLIVKAKQD
ncbi:MAG: hypothetical protein HRU19_10325 [Pseudobacteriovorax sp.]|nr:hypothetical protein [Pseudobacteriovorax sp.]